MSSVLARLSAVRHVRVAALSTGVSAIALAASLPTHSAFLGAIGAGTGLIAVGAVMLAVIDAFSRKGAWQQLHDAIEPMAEGIAFFDKDDRAVVWNSRYAALVDPAGMLAAGRTFRELLEGNMRAGAHPEALGREEEWLAERLATRNRLGSDEHKNGERWVRAERRRTRDGGLVTVCVDVTDFRWATEILAQARDAAEAANKAKSEFLANVSHELRTPLNGVLGIAEVLAHTELDPQQTEMVQTIRSSGQHLSALVADIIELARLESGKAAKAAEPFDLGATLAQVASPYRVQAQTKQIGFSIHLEPEAEGAVHGDPRRLRQILSNLLSNAVKFTDAGEVQVRVERAGDDVRFSVIDTGMGFDAAQKARLFERFQQADGSNTRKHGGTGLGLAICKQAAGLMGGDLDCDSVPGEGSVFVLTLKLPPVGAAEPAPEPKPAPEAAPIAANEPGHALRVLVVDDHPTNRKVVEMILDQVGAERVSVENGQEALEAYLNDHFDVVLMDIQMPVMDGLTATRTIRLLEKESHRPATPVIILSANALPEHVEAGKAAGANRHLGKPISAATLLEVIAEVANEQAA